MSARGPSTDMHVTRRALRRARRPPSGRTAPGGGTRGSSSGSPSSRLCAGRGEVPGRCGRHRRRLGRSRRPQRGPAGRRIRPGAPRGAVRRAGGRRRLPVRRRRPARRLDALPGRRGRRAAAPGGPGRRRNGFADRGAAVGRDARPSPRRCGWPRSSTSGSRRTRRRDGGRAAPLALSSTTSPCSRSRRTSTSLGPTATRQVIVGVDEDQQSRLPTSLAALAGGTVVLTAQR